MGRGIRRLSRLRDEQDLRSFFERAQSACLFCLTAARATLRKGRIACATERYRRPVMWRRKLWNRPHRAKIARCKTVPRFARNARLLKHLVTTRGETAPNHGN